MGKAGKALKAVSLIIVILTVSIAVFFAAIFIYVKTNIDTEADEALFKLAKEGNITEFYANGAPLGSDYYIPIKLKSTSHVKSQKVWYPISEISELLQKGFVAVEDREFYEHEGVNYRRTFAALLNTVFKFDQRFGASTITQQTVKNISGDNELTFKRKLNEIFRALIMEKNHTKDEILELYLNIVPMGENTLGVGLASEIYFDKLPSELTADEAALLIGLANAPTKYNPYINPENAREKRDGVLQTMYEHGIINEYEMKEYKNSEIKLNPRENHRNTVNSWFIETVSCDIIKDLQAKYHIGEQAAKKMLQGGGLTVYTTESIEVQDALEKYFEDVDFLSSEVENGLEYGAVIIDSVNGNLIGVIGQAGKKEGEWLLNHATAPHTPASTLKPLALYAPLIDKGAINWASVFDDVPISFNGQGEELTEYPRNSPNRYDGLITVKRALTVSKNTIAIRLYDMLGKNEIYGSLTKKLGFSTLVSSLMGENGKNYTDLDAAPLALGQLTIGVPLRELTHAYTVFPAEGSLNKNRSYIKVLDKNNNILLENKPAKSQIFKRSTAQIMNQLLSCVVSEGTASALKLSDSIDTAGKTGTSAMNKDKLFVGYTPYITFGLWCGYSDGATPYQSVSPSHLEIWDAVAGRIHSELLGGVSEEHIKHFKKDELIYLPYCKDSGRLYTEKCKYDPRGERIEYGYFSVANIPHGDCDRHMLVVESGIDNDISKRSYIKVYDRDFPKDISVEDEKYAYSDQ